MPHDSRITPHGPPPVTARGSVGSRACDRVSSVRSGIGFLLARSQGKHMDERRGLDIRDHSGLVTGVTKLAREASIDVGSRFGTLGPR